MKFKTWEAEVFDRPVNGKNIMFVDDPIICPTGLENIVKEIWDKELKNKKKELLHQEPNYQYEIKIDHEDTSGLKFKALYRNNKKKLYPDPILLLNKYCINIPNITFYVTKSYFPFIRSLTDKKVKTIYKKQNCKIPPPGFGICTFALTQDDQIVLTVRGGGTPMYPGRLHGQGGNPTDVDTTVIKHQKGEIKDEIRINKKNIDSNKFIFGGIVIDKEELKNKPDLIGWISLDCTSNYIQERITRRKFSKRPSDAIDVVFVPSDRKSLFDYLCKTDCRKFCPPAHGGLVLYGYFHFGEKWAKKLLERIKQRK